MGRKSSRSQTEGYKPVSEFKPNNKLPEDASAMDKAKAEAKESDAAKKKEVIEQSSLLKALTDAKDKDAKENK